MVWLSICFKEVCTVYKLGIHNRYVKYIIVNQSPQTRFNKPVPDRKTIRIWVKQFEETWSILSTRKLSAFLSLIIPLKGQILISININKGSITLAEHSKKFDIRNCITIVL